eukprot:314056-Hanusia_phi.AAC.1
MGLVRSPMKQRRTRTKWHSEGETRTVTEGAARFIAQIAAGGSSAHYRTAGVRSRVAAGRRTGAL